VTRRIPRANTFVGITVLVCTVASLFLTVRELTAQTALTVPAGLPDWTFNIPDKIQPTAVRPEGIVRAPAARRSTTPPRSPATRIRRTGSPMNTPLRRDR
jgi:hypothetical protein